MTNNQTISWLLKIIIGFLLIGGIAISQSFLFPLMLAFFLYLLLNPLLNFLIGLKIPRILGAALIVFGLTICISFAITVLVSPAQISVKENIYLETWD